MKNALVPTNITEAMQISEMLASSTVIPKDYVGKPANVFVAINAGMSMGLSPFQAMQNITVINGKPSVWGDAMLGMVRSSPKCLGVQETVTGEGDQRTATCTATRKNGDTEEKIERSFSWFQAKKAGLTGRGPWTAYPDRMLQMRARGFCLRDGFPDVLGGVITAEEAQDYPDAQPTLEPSKIVAIESKPEEPWVIHVPGKDSIVVNNAETWANGYEAMANQIISAKKLTKVSKAEKLIAFRSVNQAAWDELQQDHEELYNKLMKLEENFNNE